MHPLEHRLGMEAGCATPALAERVGQWQRDYMVDFKMAYDRYFAKGGKKA